MRSTFYLFLAIGFSALLISPTLIKDDKINWVSIEEAQKIAAKKDKKIFIDVYTTWCGWCKRMDRDTFSHPGIIKYMNKEFVAVKFNPETHAALEYNGKTYSGREFGRFLMSGRSGGYPTFMIIDDDLKILQGIPGYKKPNDLEKILHFFGDGNYEKESWKTFAQNFESDF